MFKPKKQTIVWGIIVIILVAITLGLSYFHLEYGIFYSKQKRVQVSELLGQASQIFLEKSFPVDFPEAEKWAKRALRYNSQNIEAYILLARSFSGQEKLEETARVYTEGLKLEPDNLKMNFYLANVYRELGEFDLADEYYKKSTELDPGNVIIWANWASGYSFNRKDWNGAVKIFEQALKINPDNEKLKELYEMALENTKNAD